MIISKLFAAEMFN